MSGEAQARDSPDDAAVQPAMEFLARICPVAADELQRRLSYRFGSWRAGNALRILEMAESILKSVQGGEGLQAHPRLAVTVIAAGSWTDAGDVQRMWAGLLASSCAPGGLDDSNLLFIQVLSQLTTPQARILAHACVTAEKYASHQGFVLARPLHGTLAGLQEVSGLDDANLLEYEIERMRNLGLLHGKLDLNASESHPDITPTPAAFHLHVRCQGTREPPRAYFGI